MRKMKYGRSRDDDILVCVEEGMYSSRLDTIEVCIWDDGPIASWQSIVYRKKLRRFWNWLINRIAYFIKQLTDFM